jgi:TolA-binding protein
MRLLFLLALLLFQTPFAFADDQAELDLVRGLRARGMPDLALQYLERLRSRPSPALAALLPLEFAKTRLEIAATLPEARNRAALQKEAGHELEVFLQSSPKHALAPEAALQLARVNVLQGKARLSAARRAEGRGNRQAEFAQARAQLEEAGTQLQAAMGKIDAQIAAGDLPPQEKQELVQSRQQAELDRGINLLEQAQTYFDQSEFQKRGELIKDAIGVLEKASRREPKNATTWLALTWLGRCHQENDDPKSARKLYAEVIAEAGEQRDAARRLARYFMMQTVAGDREDKKALAKAQQQGEDWLRAYPSFSGRAEGFGVQFELANVYLQQARVASKNSARAREMFEKAQKIYQALERSESDFSSQAHDMRLEIILAESQERSHGDIAKLRDFEECYLRAQLEVARLNEETKKDSVDKHDELKREHYKNLVAALERAIDLADATVAPDDLNDARYLLAYAYLENGDYYAAAVTGEDLARTYPRSPRAPLAGAYALRAYALIIAHEEESGSSSEDLQIGRGRLRRLAQYVEHSWPNDPAADIARHVLGLVAMGEKNYPEAVEALERIGASYPESSRVLYQLASAALRAQKEDARPPEGKPGYQERAVAALTRIPEPPRSADPATIQDYLNSKLMLADLYFHAKEYDRMEALAILLQKKLAAYGDKAKAEQSANVLLRTLYAKFGKAEADYSAGKYAEVRALLDPLLGDFQKPEEAARFAELKEKDPKLVRALLGLALCADVEDGQLERGKAALDFLQKSFPDNSVENLVQFVGQLREQLEHLRRRGESARAELEKTIANFSTFLDQLAKQSATASRPDLLLFLAQSYSSLGKHQRAIELTDLIPEPAADPQKKEADQKLVQVYRAGRLLRARELRLDRSFDAADKELADILARPWGAANLEVKRERIFVLEDQEKYGGKQGAIPAWNSLMLQMKPRLQDNKVKEQYFDCYYHFTYCIFKNALNLPEPARTKNIRIAANYIVKLEAQPDAAVEACKKNFQELLEKEPLLKEQHDSLKKVSP